MAIFFKYRQSVFSDGTKISAPKIPIKLVGKNGRIWFMGLLDSGSSMCAIPQNTAEVLGLGLSKNEEIEASTVGGGTTTLETKMKLILEGNHGEKHELTVPVAVFPDEQLNDILIGRGMFFEAFDITFMEKKKRVKLKPVA